MKIITDALGMAVELEETASGLNLVFLMLKDRDRDIPQLDQPALSQLAEVIHGHELHLLRIAETMSDYVSDLERIADQKGGGRP